MVLNTSLPGVLAEVVLQPDGIINGNIKVTPLGEGITQDMTASDGAIGHFSDFDIAAGHAVTCVQPGANANALFRVFSGDGTQILGNFDANGNVFLIDPAGILFGANSQINVNRLVASSLDISNQDFLDGRYEFFAGADNIGTIVNNGTINADEGVALIGKKILNTGIVTIGEGGFVVMAAGDRVLLGESGSNVIVEMDSVVLPVQGDGDVINDGEISSPAGTVVLAAGDVFASALELPKVSGGIGRIEQNGHIHTDGTTGDGGSVSLTSGDKTVLGSTSQTTANAGTNGNGGQVIVYSPGSAIFEDGARVEAKGGSESGNGGFFELSGKEYVEVLGDIDLTAANGKTGMFLIDPLNLTIVNSVPEPEDGGFTGPNGEWQPSGTGSELDIDILEDYLGLSNVTLSTVGTVGDEDGDIIFDADRYVHTSVGVDNSLIVKAARNIEFTRYDGITFEGNGHVELYAGPEGSVTSVDRGKNPPNISTIKGDIIVNAGRGGINLGVLKTGTPSTSGPDRPGEIRLRTINEAGDIAADGQYDITVQHLRVEGKGYGSVYVNSAGSLTINGDSSMGGAVQVRTVTTADNEDAKSYICLSAEKNETINGDVLADAQGTGKSVASIWIGAGTHFEDPVDGYEGTVTVNGNIQADASAASSTKADATIRVYGYDIKLNGDKPVEALGQGGVDYKPAFDPADPDASTGYDDSRPLVVYVDEEGNPIPIEEVNPYVDTLSSGSRAVVVIDTTKDGTCLDCSNVIRLILPIATDDAWEQSKNLAVIIEVLRDNGSGADVDPARGDLSDFGGTVYLESYTTDKGGTLSLSNDDTEVQYTPPDDWADNFEDGTYTDTFYYYAVDSDGDVSEEPALVTVTLTNTAPDAVDDSYRNSHNLVLDADEPTGVILGIGTDTDPDNTIDAVFQDDLDVESFTQPAYGAVSFDEETGAFTYTPDETKMRTNTTLEDDTFTYTISDGFGGTATATVTIDLTNQIPVANPDFYDVGHDATLIVLANQGIVEGLLQAYKDFDPDNENPDRLFDDELTAFRDNGGTTTIVGSVKLNLDGSFTYTPPAGFSGSRQISYYVTDGYDNSESVQVTMNVGSPPPIQPAPGLEPIEIVVSGCPALIQWVAAELGTDERNVQIWVAKALASPGNIQPCDACGNLKIAATILQDVEGTRVAALTQVITQFASSTAPPTEEQMASIAGTITNNIEGNTQYAAAGEYLDALAKYVGILNSEMGFSADESIQFATDNYVQKLVDGENVGVAAYVAARLAAMGGS